MNDTLEPDVFPLGRRDAPHAEALCGPTSATWRLRENGGVILAMAKARAALLQLAHPKIAAGTAEHSRFEADPYRRIRITGQTMSAILLGSAEERHEALRRLGRLHANVRGTIAGGDTYRANDPELMWFVLATLTDSDLVVEARYVRHFDDDQRDRYYRESLLLADAFGVPQALVAPDRAALHSYLDSACDRLAVGEEARRLGAKVLEPTYLRAPRPLIWGYTQLMVDLLPSSLRRGYGHPDDPPPGARLCVAAARFGLPRIPPRLRRVRVAERTP